jgi:hypothetical protein
MPNDLLTPELTTRLYDLIVAGNFTEIACRACAVSPQTYRSWIKKGEGRDRLRPAEEPYITFARRMKQAEGIAETNIVKMVVDGIPKDPSLGLKVLSRRFKDRWSETVKHEISWVVKAIHMLRSGDVTLEALESELPADDFEMVRTKFLENPIVEGEYIEVPTKVMEDAE